MNNKLIILDRDGVINQDSDAYIKSVDEWIPIPGSLQAIADLKKAGFKIAIATNQSGISRGYYDHNTLTAMHQKMRDLLGLLGASVDLIAYCPHGPDDNCSCRKPKPGMYQDISLHFNIPLYNIPVVGDSFRDLEAALTVKARPFLVKTGKGQNTLERNQLLIKKDNIQVFEDLADFTHQFLHEKT